MRKLFTLLCALLLTAQFAVAQKNLYVISKTGELTYYPATKVFFDNDLFTITYGKITSITLESFATSFEVSFKSSEVKSLGQRSEIGICFSDANTTPTIKDGRIKLGAKIGNYSFSLNYLDAGTTYYYRAYVKIGDALFYGDIRNETTFGKTPSYTIINGHKFVDLGLPSGLLWATCNIGTSIATADGDYFAWGETATKDTYKWSTYKYGDSYENITKYNSTDGKTVLDNEDDAAYVNWGTPCRMPTKAEFDELHNTDNCTWTWTSMTSFLVVPSKVIKSPATKMITASFFLLRVTAKIADSTATVQAVTIGQVRFIIVAPIMRTTSASPVAATAAEAITTA